MPKTQTQPNPQQKHLHQGLWITVLVLFAAAVGYLVWARESKEWPFAGEESAPQTTNNNSLSGVEGWQTYRNEEYGFEFKYPSNGKIIAADDEITRINLPFEGITDLQEKQLLVKVKSNSAGKCSNPVGTIINEINTEKINGISFIKEIGEDHAAGNTYYSVSYSVANNAKCIGISLVLHSINNTPLPLYDRQKESKVLDQILPTFKFIEPVSGTAGWQTYRNEEYGFEFKYPKERVMLPYESQNPGLLVEMGSLDSFEVSVASPTSINDGINDCAQSGWGGCISFGSACDTNGCSIYKNDIPSGTWIRYVHYQNEKSKIIVEFSQTIDFSEDPSSESSLHTLTEDKFREFVSAGKIKNIESVQVLDQIPSTFKFTK